MFFEKHADEQFKTVYSFHGLRLEDLKVLKKALRIYQAQIKQFYNVLGEDLRDPEKAYMETEMQRTQLMISHLEQIIRKATDEDK